MPAKKTILTDEERAKRIRETAEKHGASDAPKVLEGALKRIVKSAAPAPSAPSPSSRQTRRR